MNLEAEIRSFQPDDQADVIALWDSVFPEGAAWNRAEDVIARKRAVQPDLFFVAVKQDRVLGTIIAGFDGVRGWIHKLAIHPDFRRQGLASRLMQRAEDGLKSIGCAKVNLQVRASNSTVTAFYEALGYDIEERVSFGKPLR